MNFEKKSSIWKKFINFEKNYEFWKKIIDSEKKFIQFSVDSFYDLAGKRGVQRADLMINTTDFYPGSGRWEA